MEKENARLLPILHPLLAKAAPDLLLEFVCAGERFCACPDWSAFRVLERASNDLFFQDPKAWFSPMSPGQAKELNRQAASRGNASGDWAKPGLAPWSALFANGADRALERMPARALPFAPLRLDPKDAGGFGSPIGLVILDEFGFYAAPGAQGLWSKWRSAGACLIRAEQAQSAFSQGMQHDGQAQGLAETIESRLSQEAQRQDPFTLAARLSEGFFGVRAADGRWSSGAFRLSKDAPGLWEMALDFARAARAGGFEGLLVWALSQPEANSASKAALWHAAKAVWPERMDGAKEPSVRESARPFWEKYALCRQLAHSAQGGAQSVAKSRRRI